MDNHEHINKLIQDALSSVDNAARATPKPYLFTRLTARMQREAESGWDMALKFISKPAVALAGICLVIAINALVISNNYPGNSTAVTEDQYASVEEYNTSATLLNDIENTEP